MDTPDDHIAKLADDHACIWQASARVEERQRIASGGTLAVGAAWVDEGNATALMAAGTRVEWTELESILMSESPDVLDAIVALAAEGAHRDQPTEVIAAWGRTMFWVGYQTHADSSRGAS